MARRVRIGLAMKIPACLAVVVAFVGILSAACEDPFEGSRCTLLACNDGVTVSFQYREAGTYAVDVTVDGEKTTCSATLPLKAEPEDDPCIAKGIYLTRSGSMLPASEQFVGGVRIDSVTAKSVQVRVSRDGNVLGEASYAVEYVVSPRPNGPDCEPEECRAVTYELATPR